MKKKILAMAVVTVSFLSFNAMAQTGCAKPCDNTCSKNECSVACNKKVNHSCANPFEGLNLTSEQQAKLKEIAPCGKARKECKQKQRVCRDSIAKAQRQDYLNQVKTILTPEQYVKFLENMVVNQPKGGKKMMHGKRHPKGNASCPKAKACKDACPTSNNKK